MVARAVVIAFLAWASIARLARSSPASAGVQTEAAASREGSGREKTARGDADVLLRLVDLCSVYPRDCADDVVLRFAVRVGSPPSDARRLSRVLGFCSLHRGRCEQLAELALSSKAVSGTSGYSATQILSVDEQKIIGYMRALAEGHGRADYIGNRRKRNVQALYIRLFREFCLAYPWRCGPAASGSSQPRVVDA